MSYEEMTKRTDWKPKEENIVSKDDFLNGMEYEEVSHLQQMLYLLYKKIEELEARMTAEENK